MAVFILKPIVKIKKAASILSGLAKPGLFDGIFNIQLKKSVLSSKTVLGAAGLMAIGWVLVLSFYMAPPLKKITAYETAGPKALPVADHTPGGEDPGIDAINREDSRRDYQRSGNEVSRGAISRSDRYLMARVIEGEASGETIEGKIAVGAVIVNRSGNENFPSSIRGVVYEPLAFEAVSNGIYTRPVSKESFKAADLAIAGHDPTGGAIYYWNPVTAKSKWVWQRPIVKSIGNHVFAR